MWNMVCAYRNQRLSTDGSFLLIFPIDQHQKDLTPSKALKFAKEIFADGLNRQLLIARKI